MLLRWFGFGGSGCFEVGWLLFGFVLWVLVGFGFGFARCVRVFRSRFGIGFGGFSS